MLNETRRLVGLMGVVVLLGGGCLAAPRPQRLVPPPVAAPVTPTATPSPTPETPPSPLIETEAGEVEEEPETGPMSEDPAGELPAEPPSLLTRIDAQTPPNVAAAVRLVEEGRALLEQQSYDRALDRLERALVIDPSNAYSYYFLARLHFEQRAYDQAIAFADKSAVLSARADRLWAARAYVLQGAVFEQAGRYVDARAAYRRALAADPRSLAAQVGVTRLGGAGP